MDVLTFKLLYMVKKGNPSPVEVHHVTLSVSKIKDMDLFRTHQTIPASVSVKMNIHIAKQLVELLQKKIDNHQEGMDMITFSFEGKFT